MACQKEEDEGAISGWEFIRKHGEVIEGVLSCFDRMLFRGYLPIMSGGAMAEFLQAKGVDRWRLKTFLLTGCAPQEARHGGGDDHWAPLPVLG